MQDIQLICQFHRDAQGRGTRSPVKAQRTTWKQPKGHTRETGKYRKSRERPPNNGLTVSEVGKKTNLRAKDGDNASSQKRK